MGRFYKTASANTMDYMDTMNLPLMEKVLMTNDKYITDNINQADAVGSLASQFKYLAPDSSRAAEISQQYQSQVDALTKTISADPAGWRKQTGAIKSLTDDLKNNYQTGEISKIQGNYSTYSNWKANLDKDVEQWNKWGGSKGGVSPDRAKGYEQAYLSRWAAKGNGTGFKFPSDYNALQVDGVMGNMDVKKVLSDGLDKIKADKSNQYEERPDGTAWYFNKETQKKEQITPEKVLSIVSDNMNNPQLMSYLRNDSQVGLINGVFDKEGQFIQPFSRQPIAMSPQEQAGVDHFKSQIAQEKDPNKRAALQNQLDAATEAMNNRTQIQGNRDSYLWPIMEGLANTYSYSNTEAGNTMKANPKGGIIANIGSREKISANTISSKEKLFGLGLDEKKREFDASQQLKQDMFDFKKTQPVKGAATTKPGAKDAVGSTAATLNTVIDNAGLNPYAFSGQGGIKTSSDLVTTLNDLKGQQDKLQTDLNNETDPVKKDLLRINLQKVNDGLFQTRDYYGKALDAAKQLAIKKDGIKPEALVYYNEVINNNPENPRAYMIAQAKDEVAKASAGKPREYFEKGAMGTSQFDRAVDMMTNIKINRFNHVKASVDKNRNEYISSLNANSKRESKLVTTTALQNNLILGNVDLASDRFKIYNPVNGQDMNTNHDNYVYDNWGSKNTPLSFEGNDKSILTYLKDNNKTLADIVDVVGTTLPLDAGENHSGALVKIKFKPGIGNVGGKEFMMSIPESLQATLADQFTANKDPKVQEFGKNLADNRKYSFLNSLNRVDALSHNLQTEGITSTPTGQYSFETNDGQIHTVRSTPVKVGDKTVYHAEILINGKFEPVKTKDRPTAIFDSNEDLYKEIMPILEPAK